jgi:peptide-methionine (R)-S-oxide reductase
MTEDEIKNKLTEEEYRVLREKGTEAPFFGKLLNEKRKGMYACKVCGKQLFASDAKFDSESGWPSFDKAIPGAVQLVPDQRHGMVRTEVICANCKSHLGHVFRDGPTKTGERYCLNSVCLELKAEERN